MELQISLSIPHQERNENRATSVLDSVLKYHLQNLSNSNRLNSEKTLKEAAHFLEQAQRIEFFSIGMSYPVAYPACDELRLIGLPATIQFDTHLQIIAATQLQKGDVAFGISCSGRTCGTVKCLQIARENKASTISLSNCMRSPITDESDLVLHATPSEISYFQGPLSSRTMQLAILDALLVTIAQRCEHRTIAHLQRGRDKLLQHHLIRD
jgi:RpiR family transcriptional regulator, carbohydrate utilization regulator